MYFIFLVLVLFFFGILFEANRRLAESLSDLLLLSFFSLVASIIPVGFLLSELHRIHQPMAWAIGVLLLSIGYYFVIKKGIKKEPLHLKKAFQTTLKDILATIRNGNFVERFAFFWLFFGLIIATLINFATFIVTVPNEWDSMTGHLVKCAYYLQNGSMARIDGTTWTVDFYPNALPTLQIFFYHIFGEKGFKIIHLLSYFAFPLATYGITKLVFKSFKAAFFVFLLAALLPSALIQATTTESDIIQTAFIGLVGYFMFRFKENPSRKNGLFLVWCIGVWMSLKVTFLLVAPAVFVVAVYTVLSKKEFYKNSLLFIAIFIGSVVIYVLPTGYIGNVKEVGKFSLGALSAPQEVMNWHGIEHYSSKQKMENFTLNILRYTSDFMNFDGIRNTEIGKKINDAFRYFPNKLFRKFSIEGDRYTVVSYFSFEHPHKLYVERPFWGIMSFGMLLPLVFLLLFRRKLYSKTNYGKALYVLGIASFVHFLSLCYSAPYDPIKGRYFMNMAVWALPILGLFMISKNRIKEVYLVLCCFVIAFSGITSTLFKRFHPIFSEKNIFNTTRMEQMMVGRPECLEAYKAFDAQVPANAVVALGTQQEHEDFEYPLWGKDFKRKLIPIHPFRKAVKSIPEEAEYLFYSKGVVPFQEGDELLGEKQQHQEHIPVPGSEFYLRKLK